jgi:pimeloyl-ACP methyl ester carboxylesterase
MSTLPDNFKSNTAIILVPGSFSPPSFYTFVSKTLQEHGFHHVSSVGLLSACRPDELRHPPARMSDDALYIREVVQHHITKGRDILLVMNSYGGFPGTQAIQGLRSGIESSAPGGREGKVLGMIYLSSFLPRKGDSLRSVMGEYLFEPLKSGSKGEYMMLPEGSGPGIFKDSEFTDEKAIEQWFERMTRHSSDSFDGEVGWDMWNEDGFQGKVAYVLGENDDVAPPKLAEEMNGRLKDTPVGKGIRMMRIEGGGHCMHVTRPDVVVGAIEELLASIR